MSSNIADYLCEHGCENCQKYFDDGRDNCRTCGLDLNFANEDEEDEAKECEDCNETIIGEKFEYCVGCLSAVVCKACYNNWKENQQDDEDDEEKCDKCDNILDDNDKELVELLQKEVESFEPSADYCKDCWINDFYIEMKDYPENKDASLLYDIASNFCGLTRS